ncbi:MAG: cytochrome oxidase subunit [Rhodospirillales bacterium]|jgi:heme/copper-type cytochrome/quinol oxidase subunit 3|nr:cytochrome oxidase subunit [Rhodospirillales bacterium]
MEYRAVSDVSELPTYAFGSRVTMWWGTLAFCVLEGTGFALGIAAYLYLAYLNPEWPLSAPHPDLFWSTAHTMLMIVSLLPNRLVQQAARREDLIKVRLLLVVMVAIGIVLAGFRVMEIAALHVRWDENAYGSILWMLLGLHTVHLVTDVVDTFVVAVLMFTRHAFGKRFSDVDDNAFYWDFVALSWLPIYLLLYWGPRL